MYLIQAILKIYQKSSLSSLFTEILLSSSDLLVDELVDDGEYSIFTLRVCC